MSNDIEHDQDLIEQAHDPEQALTRVNGPTSLGPVTTIDQLAAQLELGERIIHARGRILDTVRSLAIASTHPEDWVLFRSPDGRVVAYLADSGCERVRPLFKISIFGVQEPLKVTSTDGSQFAFIAKGRGKCQLTGDVLEEVEGLRQSTEDFCKDLTGIQQELRVRQAARANLDGRVVRELAGLGSVPIEQLASVWQGTNKSTDHCRLGRGFGTQRERAGGEKDAAKGLVPPTCAVCGQVGVLRTSNKGPFFGCPQYKTHEAKRWTVDLAEWEKDPRSKGGPASSNGGSAAPVKGPEGVVERMINEGSIGTGRDRNTEDRSPEQVERERAELEARAQAVRQAERTGAKPLFDEPPPLTDSDIPFESSKRTNPTRNPRGRS